MIAAGIPELLLTYGPLGIFLICLIVPWPGAECPILVPFWYVKKISREAELKDQALRKEQEASKKALTQLEAANQLISEWRQIALARSIGRWDDDSPGPAKSS